MSSTVKRADVVASWRAEATGPAPVAAEAVPRLEPQRVVAGTAAALVNRAAEAACGEGAVSSPSVAEGFALAGGRAASRLDLAGRPSDAPEGGGAAWVYHHVADGCATLGAVGSVELVADSHQSAVDHALVAHALAEHRGRPVACRVDRALATAPGLARLPVARVVREWLDEEEARLAARSAVGGAAVAARTPESVASLLVEAGRRLGRPMAALSSHRLDGAELAVVALGSAAAAARVAVDRLRASGHRVGLLTLGLLRPLPRGELTTRLASAVRLALVTPGADASEESELADLLAELAATKDGGTELARLVCDGQPATSEALATALARLLGVELGVASEATPERWYELTLAAMPGGAWGRDLVLDLAAVLGRVVPLALSTALSSQGVAALRVREASAPEGPARRGRVDLLIVGHAAFFDVAAARGTLKDGATVVFGGEAADDAALWASLDAEQRALVRERRLSVWRADLRAVDTEPVALPRAARQMLLGAALAACEASGWSPGGETGLVERVAAQLEREDAQSDGLGQWLRRGGRAGERAGLAGAAGKATAEAVRPPRLRLAASAESSALPWEQLLRRFHLNGPGQRGAGDPSLGLPLESAALRALLASDDSAGAYPFYLPAADESAAPAPLAALLKAAASEPGALPVLGARLRVVVQTVAAVVREGGPRTPRAALEAARSAVAERFDVSESGARELETDLEQLVAALPERGRLLGASPATPIALYLAALRRQRTERLAELAARARGLVARLDERLATDQLHDAEAATPEVLSSGLGGGSALFDPGALARTLPAHRGSRRLTEAQRARMVGARAALRRVMDEKSLAQPVLVHAEPLPGNPDADGVRCALHPYPLAAALGLFDGLAAGWLDVFKAVRVARLELESAFEEAVHGPLLAEFGWSSCTADEIKLLPPVLAVERAARVHRAQLASLEELLDSGRPVHALVFEETLGGPQAWPGELGRAALAHGEAFVMQGSLARPGDLWDGFARMATVQRPAVALVTMPSFDDTVPAELLAEAALEGRAAPCFRYDPDGGRDLADRLVLTVNPAPAQGWTSRVLSVADHGPDEGGETVVDAVFTWADVAAVHASHRHHFWVVPPEAWSDEQVELAELLAEGEPTGRRALPYIWVIDAREQLCRAVVTRELALQTWDRLRAWHALQELGGVDNAYARRAAEEARARALADAETQHQALEATLREELEQVRTQTAGEAIDRLVAALLELDVTSAAALAPAVSGPRPLAVRGAAAAGAKAEGAAGAPAEAPAGALVEDEDEGVELDQPYIDSFLCTTCNECTGINPVMFKYNGDKQAFLADTSAGTYAELVQSAEKCPARCIHPGKPRAGDMTATDALVARAEELG